MPSPKSGTAGSLVAPAAVTVAEEADVADPGEVEKVKAEQRKTQAGKYGSVELKPHQPPQTKEEMEKKQSWVEVELVGEDNKPLAGVRFRITLPDNTVAEGTLNEQGVARVEGIEPGSCKITFPELDQDAWEKA